MPRVFWHPKCAPLATIPSHCFGVCHELVEAFAPAFLEAHFLVLLAARFVAVNGDRRESRSLSFRHHRHDGGGLPKLGSPRTMSARSSISRHFLCPGSGCRGDLKTRFSREKFPSAVRRCSSSRSRR